MKKKKILFYILSFVIPSIFLLLITTISNYIKYGIFSFNIINTSYNYLDFLNLSIRSLKYGNSFFTFTLGLGTDLYNIRTLYMNSLFNLLFIFFNGEDVISFVSLLFYLKIGLMGISMSFYLNYLDDNKYSYKSILFSLVYVLSSYLCNVFYLDSFILLPLIIYGIDNLITNNKSNLYIIFLSICIINNFYIGIIIILFAILYFIYKSLITFNINLKNNCRFIFSTFLCLLISSIVLIPEFYNYNNIITFNSDTYIYISVTAIILCLLFFFNGKFNKIEKIYTFIFMIVLFLLIVFKIHYLIYCYIFLITVIAFKSYINIDGINKNNILNKIYLVISNKFVNNAILILIVIELSFNGFIILKKYSVVNYNDNYINEINYIKKIDNSFYRINSDEEDSTRALYLNYNGVNLIDSNISNYFGNINNPLLESLFGIKYYVGNYSYLNNIISDNIYVNNNLDILFGIDTEFNNLSEYSYIDNMNSVISDLYKNKVELFKSQEITDKYIEDDKYHMTIKALEEGYLILNDNNQSNIISVNGSSNSDGIYYVYPDDEISIVSNYDMDSIYYLDKSYSNIISSINGNVDHFNDVSFNNIDYVFKGNINISSDEHIFTTIPYYDGFIVYVDNKKVDTYKIYDSFLGFDINSGNHDVTIKYIPKGYNIGSVVTFASIAIAFGFIRWEYFCNKVNKEIKDKK